MHLPQLRHNKHPRPGVSPLGRGCQSVKKASQSLPPAGGKGILIIFCRGMYLTENTTQAASVRIVRRRRARRARGRLQSFCQKRAKPFFDSLTSPSRCITTGTGMFVSAVCPPTTGQFQAGPQTWRGAEGNASGRRAPDWGGIPASAGASVFYIRDLIVEIRISPATTRSSAAKPSLKLSE